MAKSTVLAIRREAAMASLQEAADRLGNEHEIALEFPEPSRDPAETEIGFIETVASFMQQVADASGASLQLETSTAGKDEKPAKAAKPAKPAKAAKTEG